MPLGLGAVTLVSAFECRLIGIVRKLVGHWCETNRMAGIVMRKEFE